MVVDPTKTALPTLVVTAISAALGLIDIPPCDQVKVLLVVAVAVAGFCLTPAVLLHVKVVAVDVLHVNVPLLAALLKPAIVKLSPAKPLPVPPVIVPV